MPDQKTALKLETFRKICGMLGSAHDGERAAAAAKATHLLHRAGLTWADVTVGASGSGSAASPTPDADSRTRKHWNDLAQEILDLWHAGEFDLTERQASFIEHMAERVRQPSPKQAEWLEALADMAGVET